ncbi:hypothetical protein N9X16_00035 [Planktomarina temperata]|nr:hypothetical protein [Planktomarina temperata]
MGRQLIFFFQPSLLLITVVSLLISIGALGFYNGWALPRWMEEAESWQSLEVHLWIFYLVFLFIILLTNRKSLQPNLQLPKFSFLPLIIFYLTSTIAAAGVAYINFPFASQVAAAGFIGYCLQVANVENLKVRIFAYGTLFIPIALLLHDDKRDAIFLLLPLLLIELLQKPQIKIHIIILIKLLFLVMGLLILIILATVLRAAEYYEIINLIDIFKAAKVYIFSDLFVGYFLQNIEATYTYFHTINAIEMWIVEKHEQLIGGSYLKGILIVFPREIFEFKPQKASYWYTLFYDEEYRMAGGSWAVSMFGEAYLNFQIFGVFVLVSILKFFDYLFYKYTLHSGHKDYLVNIPKLYLPVTFLDFSRGAGLDSVAIYVCVVAFTSLLIKLSVRY